MSTSVKSAFKAKAAEAVQMTAQEAEADHKAAMAEEAFNRAKEALKNGTFVKGHIDLSRFQRPAKATPVAKPEVKPDVPAVFTTECPIFISGNSFCCRILLKKGASINDAPEAHGFRATLRAILGVVDSCKGDNYKVAKLCYANATRFIERWGK